MSAAFRRVLSGTVTRLQLRSTQAQADMAAPNVDPAERVKTAKVHFNSMLETVDRQCALWATAILEMPQDQRAEAQQQFDDYANQPDSYTEVIGRAREVLDNLDGLIIRERTSRSTHASSRSSEGSSESEPPGPPHAAPAARPPPRALSSSSDSDPDVPGPGRRIRARRALPAASAPSRVLLAR